MFGLVSICGGFLGSRLVYSSGTDALLLMKFSYHSKRGIFVKDNIMFAK